MSASTPNRVLLVAGLLGGLTLAPLGPWRVAWFQPRPNRLVMGEAVNPFELLPGLAWAILAVWVALLVLAFLPRALRAWAAAPLAAGVTFLTLYLAGAGATQLMSGMPGSARVSLLAGLWLALVAAYVAWFGALQDVPGSARALQVAPAALLALTLFVFLASTGHFNELGLMRELASQGGDFRAELARHLALAGTSLLLASLIGLPAAAVAHRRPNVARWLLPTVAFFQTVPSLALFGVLLLPLARLGQDVTLGTAALLGLLLLPLLLWRWLPGPLLKGLTALVALVPALLYLTITATVLASVVTALFTASDPGIGAGTGPLLQRPLSSLGVRGIGAAPALIALTLYALLPIVRNAFTGLQNVPVAAVEAGRGMGMSPRQLMWRVELPLALPLLIDGVRAATVLIIGITTVAYLIGAGGLGVFIQRGIDQVVPDLVLLGALPVIMLALLSDALLRAVGLLLTPAPLRGATTDASA